MQDIWGKVILFLKEHKHIALYIACGDIIDVNISDGILKILTLDQTVLEVLKDGKREIERALSWQGLDLKIDIMQKHAEPTQIEEDERVLQNVFGDKLKIIN